MFRSTKFADDSSADDVVVNSIDFIFDCFSKQVDENILATMELPFATNMAMLKIQKMVRLATTIPDGEPLVDGLLEKIDPDNEPVPSSIDSWARGAVATKKVLLEDNSYRNGSGAPSNTPSVSSFRSSATGKSRGTGGTRSRYGSEKGHNAGHAANMDKTGQIVELDDDPDADFGNLGSTGALFDMLQKTKKSKSKGFVEKDAEKGEFDLLQDQLEKASKELSGKKFVLDRYGKPVLIGKIKPESLPPFSQTLGLHVKSPPVVDDDIGNRDDLANEMAPTDKKKPKKYIRVAGSRSVDESTFKPITNLATTLSGVEHIGRVNPGVTVRSHAAVKAGDKVAEDANHMSRQQYFSKTASLQQQSMRGGDNSTVQSQLSRTFESVSGGMGVGEHSTFSAVSGHHGGGGGGGRGGSMTASHSSAKSIAALPDIDAMEGARRVVPLDSTQDLSDEELGLGHYSSTNTQAIRGKLPKKPSTAQRANIELITGSPENGKPRDRDMPKNMRPVADRRHLPAPPLGQTTGHGLSLEKYMEKSAIAANNESTVSDSEWHQQWRNA